MEEDSSAKAAPVTRLRRRLSVEPEDSPLPTTPSTPTKKRSTRLAAKPQLELIDEVASENVPKRTTRKTAAKEAESEGTGTPTPVTPSRRSTRIRSNTSLLSETITQSLDSPRAKRAIRRTSQLGSDNESAAPITPARQTRRTRKDSTTNIDKQAGASEENIAVITITSTDSIAKDDSKKIKDKEADSPSTRKSPRFNKKSDKIADTDNIFVEAAVHSPDKMIPVVSITPIKIDFYNKKDVTINTASPKENHVEKTLSTSSENLINQITNDKMSTSLNKSTSSVDETTADIKNKRSRTKSWTTLTSSPSKVASSSFTGDNDNSEKKLTRYRSISGSGDGIQNDRNSLSKLKEIGIKSPNKSINKSKTSLLNTSIDNKENMVASEKPLTESNKSETIKLFENSPLNLRPTVCMEDSDSGSVEKLIMDVQADGEDQCVPVAKPSYQIRKNSVEPMDIDETMPENVTIDDFSDKSNTSKEEAEVPKKKKSLISEKSFLNDKSINKSKRKSSISQQASESLSKNSLSKDDKNYSSKLLQHNLDALKSSDDANDKNESRNISVSMREEDEQSVNVSKTKLSVSQTNFETPRNSSISVEDEVDDHSISESKINKSKDVSSTSLNKSKRKSSLSKLEDSRNNIEEVTESFNKSKKNISLTQKSSEIDQSEKSLNKSQRKSSTSIVDANLDKLYEHSNKSINVSVLQNDSMLKQTEEETNKSMVIKENKNDKDDEIINKSKRKSSISQINSKSFEEENNYNKIVTNSKRKSSQAQNNSPNFEKSGNENKSTLVISQLKDVSTNDTNNMSPNLTNELSKSVTDPKVKNKDIDKKNLSLNNYLTSTPIQQKSMQKMAMQINTSIISPAVDSNTAKREKTLETSDGKDKYIKSGNGKKKLSRALSSSASSDEESETEPMPVSKLAINKSPKKVPALDSSDEESEPEIKSSSKQTTKKIAKNVQLLESSSDEESDVENQKTQKKQNNDSKVKIPNKKSPDLNSSDSEESEEEVSKDKGKILDDEASEASDDYESGDSRNDEDKEYEDENEIKEKGETLDSEEDISNDSDYEKDSFIVSSDAEDNEMLSGTGDDLSMSDNELTMSAKSKKKFNDRKQKQQKKASREMYEARHKDESTASSKSETSKTQKSRRQRLESSTLESENESQQPKKNNRLRIDSSQDSMKSADESIGIKKKKSKSLSESVCETTMNEKEITVFNQTTENNDPLTAAIKSEPKTPQKDFNISTVAINDNIEQVQVDSNASMMKHIETLDPLQATMEVDDEEDSLSENNEIIENYDSVLINLSLNTKKFKTLDTSLNLTKKAKDKKNPVIDQLNLTQTKKSKKNKNKNIEDQKHANLVKPQVTENIVKHDEDSSDSIDMKLLFPEDSNDSEVNDNKLKPEGNRAGEPVEHIIPLKRTEAKTNLHDNKDLNISLNKSSVKSSQSGQPDTQEQFILDNDIKLIVDTTGTHEELDQSQVLTVSSKKRNKKNKSLNETADIDCTDGLVITPEEIFFTSDKKKNKNKSFNVSINDEIGTESHKEKKSRKKSESTSDFIETIENPVSEETIVQGIPANTSIKSEKKKKNKTDTSFIAEQAVEETQSAKKKSKKISISGDNELQAPISELENIKVEPISDKKKKKKKNKQNLEDAQTDNDNADDSDGAPEEVSYRSEKNSDVIDNVIEDVANSSEKKKHKKNKKKKNKKSDEQSDEMNVSAGQEGDSKKRKRKISGKLPGEADGPDNAISTESLPSSNEKKKRKGNLDDEYIAAYSNTDQVNKDGNSAKKSKKNKSKNQKHAEEDNNIPQNSGKKRKYKEDDDNVDKISKVAKQDSFDKIHVPRLPESILNQLSEKPTKTKKVASTAIATMPFIVEEGERRKNKPSNYLEQSVYLNDSPVKKKQKHKQKHPKVLPFTPTVVTSDSGCTSKFSINLLPQDTLFVAQASNIQNFKEAFLGTQRIKKLGTFERCKAQRSHKLSKF